jgi:hypothetical protein
VTGPSTSGWAALSSFSEFAPGVDHASERAAGRFADAVFGGFPSGTKIKLVQATDATPNQKPGVGDIDWRITLKGDPRR